MNTRVDRGAVDAMVKQAVRAQLARRPAQAAELFERALGADPHHVDALVFYALLMLRSDRPKAAAELAQRAIGVAPHRGEAHHFLGLAMHRAGRLADAVASLQQAVALRPSSFEAALDLGNALLDAGNAAAAREQMERSRALNAKSAAVYIGEGNVARAQGRFDDAATAYTRAIELDPALSIGHNNLGNLAKESGDIEAAIAHFRRAVELAPNRADTWSNLLLAMNCSDRHARDKIFSAHRAFGQHFEALITRLRVAVPRSVRGKKLKIGYVSSDWRRHAVAVFFEPLLAARNRSRFEIFCYYNFPVGDEVTDRIRGLADHFRPIAGMTDDAVAEQIRTDGIDILVDMNGHTAYNRLPLFIAKPAPIQVTWLGYLATTGLQAVDYRFTDPYADPVGLTEALHTETLWRLPATQWCYQPHASAPAVMAAPSASNGFVTFGCLNNASKMSPTVIALWADILLAVPASRLMVLAPERSTRSASVRQFFAQRGIADERIELVAPRPVADYLALYHRIDVALDSFPCVGGTTTLDALWMGVPVISLAGDRSFARSGASILRNVGLADLVATNAIDYVSRAVALANDRERCVALRATLRNDVTTSCLTDAARFAADVEAAYEQMYAGHLQQAFKATVQ